MMCDACQKPAVDKVAMRPLAAGGGCGVDDGVSRPGRFSWRLPAVVYSNSG